MARKQRQFTAQFKLETVLEEVKGEKSIAQICRERQVTDSLMYPTGMLVSTNGVGNFWKKRSGSSKAR
jgi:hypothetical protein